jgi:hypothetical protein
LPRSKRAAADGSPVRVALANLLGKAWKYSGKKPNARIRFGARRGSEQKPSP